MSSVLDRQYGDTGNIGDEFAMISHELDRLLERVARLPRVAGDYRYSVVRSDVAKNIADAIQSLDWLTENMDPTGPHPAQLLACTVRATHFQDYHGSVPDWMQQVIAMHEQCRQRDAVGS